MHAWQQRENERTVAKFDTDAKVDAHGIVRWKSNNRIPPKDILRLWAEHGKPFNEAQCLIVRAEETSHFLHEYRQAALNAPLNPEVEAERAFEMRAAFGPGCKIVNVVTGQEYNT